MGNSEVGHLNIGAGRVVMQELPRIGERDRRRLDRPRARAHRPDRQAEGERRHLPSDRPGIAGRRAFAPGPRRGAGQNPARAGVPTVVHAFTDGRDTPPQSAATILTPDRGAAEIRCDRHRVRPLLRDGPRQALGPRRQGLQRHGRRRRSALSDARSGRRRRLRQQKVRRVHRAGRDRRLSRHAGRRRHPLLQLPRRPRARNPRRDAGCRISPVSRASAPFASPPRSA